MTKMRHKKFVYSLLMAVLVVYLIQQKLIRSSSPIDDKKGLEKSLSSLIDVVDKLVDEKLRNAGVASTSGTNENVIDIEHFPSFLQRIQEFQTVSTIQTVCEFGFGNGHTAAIFLAKIVPKSYIAFGKFSDFLLQANVFKDLNNKYNKSKIEINSLDSIEHVNYNVLCDLIHVNAELVGSDLLRVMKSLFYIVARKNLLLISSKNEASPIVLNGVEFLKNCNVVNDIKHYLSINKLVSWYIGSFIPPVSGFVFLNKTFCNPFFEKKDRVCVKSVLKPCSATSMECFYNSEIGVVSISCEVWHEAQKNERNIWVSSEASSDRSDGHTLSYNNYTDLPNHLGDVLEIGAGPFTQSKSILSTRTAKSITLVEPNAFQYIQFVKHCFYKDGMFMNLPTTICSIPAEEFQTNVTFDTVIMINVIEHVYDALHLLNAAAQLVKIGGLFIFQERSWDKWTGKADYLHPIRIKTPILKQVVSGFEEIYSSTDAPELRKYRHQGIYFIGRKRSEPVYSVLPKRQLCKHNRTIGSTVVLFTAPINVTISLNQIKIAENSIHTKAIILIQTSVFNKASLSKLIRFSKIKAVVSHHHLQQWQKQIHLFTSPCDVIHTYLNDYMLETFSAVCIGQ